MEHAEVMQWAAAHEGAWRSGDLAAVEVLFTEGAKYRASPYEPSEVGHEAIKAFWADDVGRSFTADSEVVALEGNCAVLRVEVCYLEPTPQEYRDLWVLTFSEDGRVADYEEWAYWPGKRQSAAD